MSYEIRVHPRVKQDVSRLDPPVWKRVKDRLQDRLSRRPEYFGQPLRGTLKGLWKFRVGDYRVVYRIDESESVLRVLAVAHRKNAYDRVRRRLE